MVNSILGMALTPTRNSYRDLKEIQQAQQSEHRKNNAKTAFGLGLAVGLPTAAGYAVYKNPDKAEALLTQYGKKADTIFNNKFVNKAKEVISNIINKGKNKVEAEKVTSNVTKNIDNVIEYAKNNAKEIKNFIKKGGINPEKIDYNKIKGKVADLLSNPDKLVQKIKDFIENFKISTTTKNTKLNDMLKNPHNVIDEVSNSAKKAAEKFKDVKQKLNVNIDAKTIQKNGLLSKIKTHVGDAINKLKGTKVYDAASKAVKDFMSKTPAQKGKIALVAAGVALATGAIINIIRNHDYKAGKIDQKYEDMKSNNPIIDARTGVVISKADYEKLANTYLK
jgi:hypothetical protein